jgi:hypothetical protein
MSLKVSDEFTVPLCAIHHHHIHTTGDEGSWWKERNIDPLKVAAALWQQIRQRQQPVMAPVEQSEGAVADGREAPPLQQASSDGSAEPVRDLSMDAGGSN